MKALTEIISWMKHRSTTSAKLAKEAEAELAEMKKDLAKCFLELSECGSETFADELAEKYFDTWNEIRELVKGTK